jgi:transposase
MRVSVPVSPPVSGSALKELEKENKELRRANEILKAAAAFFGAELDRRPRK